MFDIQGGKIKISTEDLAIPPFRKHYELSKNKAEAIKEIEYVVWLCGWNTPYLAYPEKERAKIIAKDVFGCKYEPSSEVKDLIERFKEFLETPATRLLSASLSAAEGLFETLTLYSKLALDIDTAIKVTRILKDVGGVVKSLDLAMKQARSELADAGRIKGGGVIGLYENPK